MGETEWADLRTHVRTQGDYVHALTALVSNTYNLWLQAVANGEKMQPRTALISKSAGANTASPC